MIEMPLQEHFRENVRRRRLELGLTQKQLADKMGCTHPYISQVENGESNPSLDVVERFARALDWSPVQILIEPVKPDEPAKKVRQSA
jgi:transcriptional regulator with XRE-family HTH domain